MSYKASPDIRCNRSGVDLISDALPFGRLWYGDTNAVANAFGYAQHYSRSHGALIRVYDDAGNVIETHEQKGDFRVVEESGSRSASRDSVLANFQCFSPNCLMKTFVAFIIALLIATSAWAQVDHANGIVWLPAHFGTLHGSGYHHARYQMGLRNDGVVVWRWIH